MSNRLSPDLVRSIQTAVTASTQQVQSHQRASNALSHYEMELANPERGLCMDPDYQDATRLALKRSLKFSQKAIKKNSKLLDILLAEADDVLQGGEV